MGDDSTPDARLALHAACASGSLDDVKALVASGADAHATDEHGRGLLHVAVAHAELETITYLIDKVGLDVLVVDQRRESLLHVAVRRRDVKVVEFLVDKGVRDAPYARCPNRSQWGNTSQKLDQCPDSVLEVAARHAGLEMVQFLVDHGFPVDPSDWHQRHLLETAIETRDVELVDLIVRGGVDLLATASTGKSMMSVAARHGGLPVVKYFVNKGVWEDGHVLMTAAVEGDHLDVVKYLATMRVSLHTSDRVSGKNLMHLAVEKASLEMIQHLVNKDVSIWGATKDGRTLVHAAIERGDMEILRFLVSLGLDVQSIAKENLMSVLAARSGSIEMLEYVLEHGGQVDAVDKRGYSLAHLAVWRDNLLLLKVIEARGLCVQDVDSAEMPLLRLAVAHSSIDLIKHLVSKGVSVHSTDKTGRAYILLDPDQNTLSEAEFVAVALGKRVPGDELPGKFSLLHAAVQRGAINVIQYLVDEGLDVHSLDKMGRSLLHLAVEADLATVTVVLKLGVSIDVVDKRGFTALHCAIQTGRLDVIKALIANGLDHQPPDSIGPSLLSVATSQRDLDITKCILERLSSASYLKECGGGLLRAAVASGSKETVQYLLDNGIEPSKDEENAHETSHLLHLAVENQDVVLLEYLISYGLDAHAVDRDGNNLLHTALRQHIPPFSVNLQLIAFLCEKNVDVNAVGKRGNTPLHIACSMQDEASAKLLLARGATGSLAVQNEVGMLPLHIASHRWDAALVAILLEAGADVSGESRSGVTPLGTALSSSQLPIERDALQRLYSTVRALCLAGASWTQDCDRAMMIWPEQMYTRLERMWSKDSMWSTGLESDVENTVLSTQDQQELQDQLDHDLEDALSVKGGIRQCVIHWGQEDGNNGQLSQIPIQVLARGEPIVVTYLAALKKSNASQLLYRRKICVTGPTNWGKTSLIKSLTSARSQLVPEGDRTVGIDLFSCSFIEDTEDSVKCHDITFWDFTGQDGYQAVQSVFFSRQTLFLVCIDLNEYSKSLAMGAKEARSHRESEAELSRFVGRSVFSWIRLIFARQPDAEMIFVGTKADMLTDSKQIEAVKQDLQVRLSTWKRRLQKEIDEASIGGGLTQFSPDGLGGVAHSGTLAEKLKMQVMKLLSCDWLIVSTVDETAVDEAWDALAEKITTSDRSFVIPEMHSQVLTIIRTKQAAASRILNGKDRVEACAVPVNMLCKTIMNEVNDLGSDDCLHILRTLHDMGDILFVEDSRVGPLQDIVVVDPLLVIDLVREILNHEQVGDGGAVASDGRVSHDLLMKCYLWKDMDSELVYAFKLLLQFYQVAYPSDGNAMDWDSDLIVPAYWKARQEAIPQLPLVEQKSELQLRGIQPSVYVCWDYELSSEVSDTVFEQFAVESYTPLFQRQAWQNCIESSAKGEFASRLEVSAGQLNLDVIRIEVAGEDSSTAWRYMRFYVMAMETVLDRYPGLLVSRHIVDLQAKDQPRYRVHLAARTVVDALRVDQDDAPLRSTMPWIPPDFDWFVERAWKNPSILHRLRTRELVRHAVDKMDVLRRLVVSGDNRRRYPALWTCLYDEHRKKITVRMMSDLSGICYHVPIEISVPPAFVAEYGTWIQHGLSICANVVPKLLSLGIIQQVFQVAALELTSRMDRVERIHNLIDSLELSTTRSFDTRAHKLPPAVAVLMLERLLSLHDATFDARKVSQISNLECAVTRDEGHMVWAHRQEILDLKDQLELCDPDVVKPSARQSSVLSPQPLPLRLSVRSVKGLDAWDWHQVYCSWDLFYGENRSPIASDETSKHDDTTVEPTWKDATFDLSCVGSIAMLRDCRLAIHVKRRSRFLGSIKSLHKGSVWLRDFLAKDATSSVRCDPITIPFDATSPSRRYATCELSSI